MHIVLTTCQDHFRKPSTVSKIAFSARFSKNIKISTFEKTSKSSHFRPDNQRQISLDLSRGYSYWKRMISLTRS
jgi:hypothetical protein